MKGLNMTISLTMLCHFAECRVLFTVIINAGMQSVVEAFESVIGIGSLSTGDKQYQCLQRERFITQLCLHIWSGGMPALLPSPLSDIFFPTTVNFLELL